MSETRTILFLCPHGAAKSVMATAYWNQFAARRGVDIMAIAADVDPSPRVTPAVVATLRGDGLDVSGDVPRRVTAGDLAQAWRVVSLGCDLSDLTPVPAGIERWDDVPLPSEGMMASRTAIVAHVQRMLETLTPECGGAVQYPDHATSCDSPPDIIHYVQRLGDVGGVARIPGVQKMGRHPGAQVTPPQGRTLTPRRAGDDLAQKDGVITAIHAVDHAALEQPEAITQKRRTRDAGLVRERGELVGVVTRLKAEVVDDLVLIITQQMDGERARLIHQVVSEVRLPQAGRQPGALGHDRRAVYRHGDLTAAPPAGRRRHGNQRRPQ